MLLFKRFLLMVQFFTTIPIPLKLKVTSEDFGRGLAFAPFVGLILGGILAAEYYGLQYIFPFSITTVILIVSYIILTGGLHFDGLGDTFDGLFSNRPKERALEIMHDSRVGTNAVLAILCMALMDTVLLYNVKPDFVIISLIMMPVSGRMGALVGAGISNYARKDESLGKPFIDYCGMKELIIGLAASFAIFFAVAWLKGLLMAGIMVVVSVILAKYFGSKIGGITGDILGAICEINQAIFLILIYVIQKIF